MIAEKQILMETSINSIYTILILGILLTLFPSFTLINIYREKIDIIPISEETTISERTKSTLYTYSDLTQEDCDKIKIGFDGKNVECNLDDKSIRINTTLNLPLFYLF